ncbi:MAG TPA: helix-turn-helix domain-containing protein [Polyangiaceae bacterium]|nr:helix-turn-helix domain-containing protein [Polyangiaceae bacterium]
MRHQGIAGRRVVAPCLGGTPSSSRTRSARGSSASLGARAPPGARRSPRALLLADAGRGDAAIASELGLAPITLWRLRKRAAAEGPLAALECRRPRRPRKRALDAAGEALLLSLAAGPPPPGRTRWTLLLLAKRLVELDAAERVCYETVRQVLKRSRGAAPGAPARTSPP